MGYGWEGCIHEPPPVYAGGPYDRDYGVPLELCKETAPGAGVFTRRWSKAHVAMDCNSFAANITMMVTSDGASEGHHEADDGARTPRALSSPLQPPAPSVPSLPPAAAAIAAGGCTIRPGTIPLDTDGNPVHAHGAGIYSEGDNLYLLGLLCRSDEATLVVCCLVPESSSQLVAKLLARPLSVTPSDGRSCLGGS